MCDGDQPLDEATSETHEEGSAERAKRSGMEIPGAPSADLPALIESERMELTRLLDGLTVDDWNKASPCPGWSVGDVALHILGDDLGAIARDRDHFFGTAPPEAIETEADLVSFLEDVNDLWVRANRRLSPQLVTEMLRWTGEQLVAAYREQDETAVAASVSWASDGSVPKWLDQARELTERWVHHQQIRAGLGAPSWLDPRMTAVVLDTFFWAYPYRLSGIGRPIGTSVQIKITGVVERDWWFVVTAAGWSLAEGNLPEEPTVGLSMDADQAWLLLTNGLSPELQPVPVVNTDPELAQTILRTRAIIGLPNTGMSTSSDRGLQS
jgi:uncharacterized protein (TIGR03083 family)